MPKGRYYPCSYAQRTEKKSSIEKICACGCGQTFFPVTKYRPKSEGGGRWYPDYIRGHNPVSKSKINTGEAWNKGLTKEDHPSISKMGYQPGHKPYNDWSHVNRMLREDKELRERWLASKRGQIPWNLDITKDQYPKGIKPYPRGADHGAYKGNDVTRLLKRFIIEIFERDNYTCRNCLKHFPCKQPRHKLHCHHIRPLKLRPDLMLEPSNLITLCAKCHVHTHRGKLPHLIQTD